MNDKNWILLSLNKSNKKFDLSDEELEKKVTLLTDMGFIYNPYSSKFINYFINKTILSNTFLLSLNIDDLKDSYRINLQKYLNKFNVIKSNKELEKELKINIYSKVIFYIESLTGILGLICFLLTIMFTINKVNINTQLINSLIGFFLIHNYFLRNTLIEKYEYHDFSNSISLFWIKTKILFTILTFIYSIIIIYELHLLKSNFWTTIIIVIFLREIIFYFTKWINTKYYISREFDYLFVNDNKNKVKKVSDIDLI